jgi:cell wall-associated NlpC family hydrolase
MTRRFILVVFYLATASAASSQQGVLGSSETLPPRPIARAEGHKILAAIPIVGTEPEFETDCSHLVHDVYDQAGFPYTYVSSRELYTGSANFTRVRKPQPGDLVVWLGHVGIVIDPKQRSFFSFVRSGPDTQFYDSAYWRSRGIARFYRYVAEKDLKARRTLEAADRADRQPPRGESAASESRPASRPAGISFASNRATPEASRGIVLQMAGKSPSSEEVAAAFVEMNRDFGESLHTRSLNGLGKTVVVYREMLVSAVQTTGKHGTALIRIQSLGAPTDTQTDSPLRWKEQPLEFERTRKGWVMTRPQDVAYVKREVALQVLSARLSALARNTGPTPEQKDEQKEIIRLLNWLVVDDSRGAAAQNN